MAEAIDSFLDGSIDNWALDDAISSIRTRDMMCKELRGQVWLFYDDVGRYRNIGRDALPHDAEAILRRWVRLLRSSVEWADVLGAPKKGLVSHIWERVIVARCAPRPMFRTNIHWPLRSASEWGSVP